MTTRPKHVFTITCAVCKKVCTTNRANGKTCGEPACVAAHGKRSGWARYGGLTPRNATTIRCVRDNDLHLGGHDYAAAEVRRDIRMQWVKREDYRI